MGRRRCFGELVTQMASPRGFAKGWRCVLLGLPPDSSVASGVASLTRIPDPLCDSYPAPTLYP